MTFIHSIYISTTSNNNIYIKKPFNFPAASYTSRLISWGNYLDNFCTILKFHEVKKDQRKFHDYINLSSLLSRHLRGTWYRIRSGTLNGCWSGRYQMLGVKITHWLLLMKNVSCDILFMSRSWPRGFCQWWKRSGCVGFNRCFILHTFRVICWRRVCFLVFLGVEYDWGWYYCSESKYQIPECQRYISNLHVVLCLVLLLNCVEQMYEESYEYNFLKSMKATKH